MIDRDAAKDSRSSVTVRLATTDGAKVEVECVLADVPLGLSSPARFSHGSALEEGRVPRPGADFLQLGGKDSPSVVPLGSNMPRSLIGKPIIPKEANVPANMETDPDYAGSQRHRQGRHRGDL